MKAPRITIGSGTLGRFKRSQPLVTISLQSNGYGSEFGGDDPATNWSVMSVSEVRKLAWRLSRAADRAEGRGVR